MQNRVPCPKCGEENYATDAQCLACGATLGAAGPAAARPGAAPVRPGTPPAAVAPGRPAREAPGGKKKAESVLLSQPIGPAIGAFLGAVPVYFLQRFLVGAQLEHADIRPAALTGMVAGLALVVGLVAAWTLHDLGPELVTGDGMRDWRMWVLFFGSGFIGIAAIFIGAYAGGGIEYLISGRGSGKSARGR